jgi:hypothetical protein
MAYPQRIACLTEEPTEVLDALGEEARVLAVPPERRRCPGIAPAARTPVVCSNCGATFGCGATDPHNACWCTHYPPVAPRAGQASCLCPQCLAAAA